MHKTIIKWFLLTTIFSTQLSLNAFAMDEETQELQKCRKEKLPWEIEKEWDDYHAERLEHSRTIHADLDFETKLRAMRACQICKQFDERGKAAASEMLELQKKRGLVGAPE